MTESQYITQAFAEIVAGVNTELLATLQAANPNIEQVGYQHGHITEIIETLQQYSQSKTKRLSKFPLVMLIEDIPTRRGGIEYYGEATMTVLIAMSTKKDLKSAQRETETFEPILYPIYYELLNQIDYHSAFITRGAMGIDHTKIDRKYWGREGEFGTTANKINDYVDAIEIRDLRLTVNFTTCLPAANSYT